MTGNDSTILAHNGLQRLSSTEHCRYDDGVAGEIDLSHLASRRLFAAWQDPSFFSAVRLDTGGFVVWSDDIDLCGDALYLKLTGMSPEERFPSLAGQSPRGCSVSPREHSRAARARTTR